MHRFRVERYSVNVLIIDTETTGLDPAKGAECIEIGAILYNVPNRAILAQVSTLLPIKVIGQEETHGISLQTANAIPLHVEKAAHHLLSEMALDCSYIVAHNAAFDRQFLSYFDMVTDWLCTYEDFNFEPYKKQNLVSLALAHGVPVISAHRALTDCRLIASIFSKRDDLEALIEAAIIRAKSPKVWVRALVSFDDKDKAKAANFKWMGTTTRDWRKQMKECDLHTLDFKWEVIES
jgi:DNA polymerase III subunit epsilon